MADAVGLISTAVVDGTTAVTDAITNLPGNTVKVSGKVLLPAQEAVGLGHFQPSHPDLIKAVLTSPMQPMNDLAASATGAGKSVPLRMGNFKNGLSGSTDATWGELEAHRDAKHGLDKPTEGLTEAIIKTVGPQRAPGVAQAFARHDVVAMKWLLDLTHLDAMKLADESGLTRHEMLRLREATADIHTKQLIATGEFVQPEASIIPGIPQRRSSRFGLKSLLSLQCIGRPTKPVVPGQPSPAASRATSPRPSRYTKDRRHKEQDSDFYAHVPRSMHEEWVEPKPTSSRAVR